jgi:hypothetical protein
MRSSTVTNTPNASKKTAAPISRDSLVTRSCPFSLATKYADVLTRASAAGGLEQGALTALRLFHAISTLAMACLHADAFSCQ